MKLTRVERERVTDSILKIQSVRRNLDAIENAQIPNAEAIEGCLEAADESLKEALGYSAPQDKRD